VPRPEDIAPARLAEWLKERAITVAHLAPALGELLAEPSPEEPAGSPTLPSVRYAFFGGDCLTTSDVARFKGIAPSARCANFYGATETPQAMGFFVVPDGPWPAPASRVVPLGRGIEGAQLLVLKSGDEMAGVGETGEIHVRR